MGRIGSTWLFGRLSLSCLSSIFARGRRNMRHMVYSRFFAVNLLNFMFWSFFAKSYYSFELKDVLNFTIRFVFWVMKLRNQAPTSLNLSWEVIFLHIFLRFYLRHAGLHVAIFFMLSQRVLGGSQGYSNHFKVCRAAYIFQICGPSCPLRPIGAATVINRPIVLWACGPHK